MVVSPYKLFIHVEIYSLHEKAIHHCLTAILLFLASLFWLLVFLYGMPGSYKSVGAGMKARPYT